MLRSSDPACLLQKNWHPGNCVRHWRTPLSSVSLRSNGRGVSGKPWLARRLVRTYAFYGREVGMTRRSHGNDTTLATKSATKTVHFEFHHADAREVSIAGTFNDWRPDATPMVRMGQGRWAKDLTLGPGVYEYLFV